MTQYSGYISCFIQYDHANRKYINKDVSRIQSVRLWIKCESPEAAAEFVAAHPKMLRLKSWKSSNVVEFCATFQSDGVTGDKNETSYKRSKKFMELFGANFTLENLQSSVNNASPEEFVAFLNA